MKSLFDDPTVAVSCEKCGRAIWVDTNLISLRGLGIDPVPWLNVDDDTPHVCGFPVAPDEYGLNVRHDG